MTRKPRVTMRLIADELGVSISLVSRVLSGKASEFRISERTEKAIRRAAEKYDYSPNRVARGLRLQRTSTIGIIVPNISNPFFSSVVRHIERTARESGYTIVLADSQDDEQIERSSLEVLRSTMVDGVIAAPCGTASDHFRKLDRENFPIVCVDGYFPDSGVPYVISDHVGGSALGAAHLLAHGHTNIALVQGYPDVQVSMDRLRGFRSALAEFGLPLRDGMVVGEQFTYESGYVAVKKLLDRQDPPTGLLAVNNEIALGALRAIEEKRLSVPKDISVVAFDDLPWIPHLRVPMTTIAQNYDRIGRSVVELLDARIQRRLGRDELGQIVPMHLVERGSVAAPGRKSALKLPLSKPLNRSATGP